MPTSSEITTALQNIRSDVDLKTLSAWDLLIAIGYITADSGGGGGGGTSAGTITTGVNNADFNVNVPDLVGGRVPVVLPTDPIAVESEGVGNALTIAAEDGDLSAIDTANEVASLSPVANTSGNATSRYSLAFLLRWLVYLTQRIHNRLPEGLASSGAFRTEDQGVGLPVTTVAADGDLQNIDTITEAYTVNPAANTSGAASARHSSNFLLRWLVQLVQNLRVQGNIAAGITDSGNPVKIGGKYNATKPALTDGQRGDLQLSPRAFAYVDFLDIVSNPNNINTADVASSSSPGQNNQNIITGNATNNSTASVEVSGSSSFAVLVTGTWTGTLQFERSLDNGTTWTSVGAFSAGTNFIGQTITQNGAFHGNASSATHIRMRATAWSSGVASVRILAGQGTGTITIGNPIRLFDAVSGSQASIKAASTPAAATDTAIVVAPREVFSRYRNTALSNTASEVKSSAAALRGWNIINVNATPVYIKFYDSLAAGVTVGTTTPFLTLLVPPQVNSVPGCVLMEPICVQDRAATALSIACVTGLADNSTAAPTTPVHISLRYE